MNIEESIKEMKSLSPSEEAIETLLTAYEKEKETSHYIQSQLDIANAKLVEEKEKNKLLEENYSSAHKDINWFCENYIHKDKVIAKVIEIKDRPVKDEFITATQGKLNTIIDIESLLDEEE